MDMHERLYDEFLKKKGGESLANYVLQFDDVYETDQIYLSLRFYFEFANMDKSIPPQHEN